MRSIGHAEFSSLDLCSVAILGVVSGCTERPVRAPVGTAVSVSVITDAAPGPAAVHGLAELRDSLRVRGVIATSATKLSAARGSTRIVAGLATGSGSAARLRAELRLAAPEGPGAFLVRWAERKGGRVLLICGTDDRGLMYGELEIAERVGWATDPKRPFARVGNTTRAPAVRDRALSIYTMHPRVFESRLFDTEHWERYFDLLAKSRFNRFVLIFGYENGGYMAPPYPYFFDVEGFRDVRVSGLTAEQRQKNLAALNRLIDQAHARGLEFTIGIWDHIYRGGVQSGGPREMDANAKRETRGLVWGLTKEKLMAYSVAALRGLLTAVPKVDSLQFRMHGESGLRRSEMADFWRQIYDVVKSAQSGIRFDARAKNFPDSLIDLAVEKGINIRICTKYWMEQMGLPFHPTHIHPRNQHDRRHGYADLLRYPRRYKMHWRLWNGGTTRILLWGDPDYARRFAASTHLYDGDGFEVNEPLATKMEAQPHAKEPFALLRPSHRYYEWEFERYWHFFQVFGRLGYDPATPAEVWEREFARRFGPQAGPEVMRGLHRASRILPRIIAYCFPYGRFPTTRGWAEKQHHDDLPVYAKALPSDTEQFLGPDAAARAVLEGTPSAKITPSESSVWFERVAQDVIEHVRRAEARIGPRRSKEFASTMVDLRVLAGLALFHSRRARAGLSYALFRRTRDLFVLDDALADEETAVQAWETIVAAAGDVYADDLAMGFRGAGLCGHWRDELALLRKGLAELRAEASRLASATAGTGLEIAHVPIHRSAPGEGLIVRATVRGEATAVRVRFGTSATDQRFLPMRKTGPLRFAARVPADAVVFGLSYTLEAVDRNGRRAVWPAAGGPHPVTVTDDRDPPTVVHEPLQRAPAARPLSISARVRDRAGVKWVRLRYRSVTQFEDFKTIQMQPTGDADEYAAVVPAEHVPPGLDFMYFLEVMDTVGNGSIHPDLEETTPYVIVELQR